jgi:hypothetical protein
MKAPGLKVDDRVWRRLKLKVATIEHAHVKVGVVGSDALEATEEGFTMVELAAVHEFGSRDGRIPERSFIRRTMTAKADDVGALAGKLARGIINDRFTVLQALGLLGEFGAAEIKKTITDGDGVPPPNAPTTIARKGSDRPLVDTGRLVQSITSVVSEHGQ